MKKTILMATGAIVAAGLSAVEAQAIDVEVYGQVNKGVMVFDDGQSTEFNIVDNDRSSTRFGFKGSAALDNGLVASVLFENEMESASSNGITQSTGAGVASTPTSNGSTSFVERQARVGLAGDFGAIFIGQQSVATDGAMEQDLVGVSNAMNQDIEDIGGGLQFRNSAGGLTGTTVSNAFADPDGARGDAIAYVTPTVNGFTGVIDAAQGGDIDAAVKYSGKMDAVAVKGALGYRAVNSQNAAANNNAEDVIMGSVSAKHDNGLAGTIAYAQTSLNNKAVGVEDPENLYVKVGYAWDAFEVAADYANADNNIVQVTDNELTSYGVGGQVNMGKGVSVAAYYRQFDLDLAGTATDELNIYGVNLRVKF